MKPQKKPLWKLTPTIAKNLVLICWDWLRRGILSVWKWKIRLYKKFGWKFSVAAVALIVLIIIGGVFSYRAWHRNSLIPAIDKLSLAQAAKMGTKTTHELLIQIENSKCNPAMSHTCYQRGDVVLTVEGEKQWSEAETEGFLIIKMDLTPTEAQLLVHPLETLSDKKTNDPSGRPNFDQKQLRRFAVDLTKIGIGAEDQSGRLVEDKIFTSDMLIEKKQ